MKSETKTAYVDAAGQLFIETPFADSFTIYQTIAAYNERSELPVFKPKKLINTSTFNIFDIDLKTLTISK